MLYSLTNEVITTYNYFIFDEALVETSTPAMCQSMRKMWNNSQIHLDSIFDRSSPFKQVTLIMQSTLIRQYWCEWKLVHIKGTDICIVQTT